MQPPASYRACAPVRAPSPVGRFTNGDYIDPILTLYSYGLKMIRIPAHRGASSGDVPKAELGVASRGCDSQLQAREAREPPAGH